MKRFLNNLFYHLLSLPIYPLNIRFSCLAKTTPRHQRGQIQINHWKIQYIDLLSLYMEYKDIFQQGIYDFKSKSLKPYIIDGGGYIGMSVLQFKSIYPDSKVICFEPDENIFKVLQNNIQTNNLTNVELIQAGLASENGEMTFLADGTDGGTITKKGEETIKTVCLSDYINQTVDFLKLNIEGQELPVLQEVEASGKLQNIKELVLEYHGWSGEEQRLGEILTLLDRNGFRYLIHDFDRETNLATKPPFQLTPQTTWFCLVYAKNVSGGN